MSDALDLLFAPPEDELGTLLAELRWLTLRHPIAAHGAVRALIAEGRRFAATPEGAAWRARLAESELVRRGQLLWDVGTWGALDGDEAQLLPSELVDMFARASARVDLEASISERVEANEGNA